MRLKLDWVRREPGRSVRAVLVEKTWKKFGGEEGSFLWWWWCKAAVQHLLAVIDVDFNDYVQCLLFNAFQRE